MTQLTDEIFEKLRSRFEIKRCPARPGKCECEDVIYTGGSSVKHTFNWSRVIIAKTGATCPKWKTRDPHTLANPDLETTSVAKMSGKELKDILKQASAREAEFLAYAHMPKFNKGCVIINGAVFEQKTLRVGLMYQDSQVFDIYVANWKKDIPVSKKEGCPELHLIGDKHHIVISGQWPPYTAEHIGVTTIGYD